jgi:cytochrome oxidase assembly protein ShyY1
MGSGRTSRPSTRARQVLTIAALVLSALAISSVSVVAARWQWGRHETRSHTLAAYNAAANTPVEPLASLDPSGGAALPPGSEWRMATVTGSFETESLTVLRNRAIDGARVSEYLAWFTTDDGRSLLVLTGWEPLVDGAPKPTLPAGTVQIQVELRNQEQDDAKRGDGATRILSAQMPPPAQPPLAGFGVLRGPCDATCTIGYGTRVPDPQLSLGPHFAYTVQWYAFAVLAPAGVVLMLTRGRFDPDEVESPPKRQPRRGPGRPPTDEEIEDAL